MTRSASATGPGLNGTGAAERGDDVSLVKMLDKCRATVFSDRNRMAAISGLLRPAATSRSTSTSRGLSPHGASSLAHLSSPSRAGGSAAAPSPRASATWAEAATAAAKTAGHPNEPASYC
jgi:hypothetical protein